METWETSGERARSAAIGREDWYDDNRYRRVEVCLMDFCTRIRAERNNGVSREP